MRYFILGTFISALALSGCTALTPPRPYDTGLYDHYVKATVEIFNMAQKCNDPKSIVSNVNETIVSLDEALIYAKYRDEPELVEATTLIKKDLNQLLVAYDSPAIPSEFYCRLKLQTTEASLINILEAIGGKPQ